MRPFAASARRWVGALSAWALVFVGCAHPTFTAEVRERYQFTGDEIRHIQFYTSGKIVLRREEPYQDRRIVKNELVIEDRLRIDDVVIRRGTPGVALRVEGDHLLVSFSREHRNRALWFSRKHNSQGRYELSHLAVGIDEQPFVERYMPGFQVTYDKKPYRVLDPDGFKVYLEYEDPQSFDEGVETNKPEGWRLR
jgi:hypothetical protein